MTMKDDNTNYSENLQREKKSYSILINRLKKEFGDTIRVFDGSREQVNDVVSTGSLSLDIATGIGGYPRGRITQIAGWESTGKTTHALMAAANVQSRGGSVAYIDTEFVFDPVWADKIGVNTDSLLCLQVDDLESAAEATVDIAQTGDFDMIIFDSIAAAGIRAVHEGELGDSNMGKRAKIMSDFMTKLNGVVSRNNIWMIFVNQLRESLDPYKPLPVRPGGKALSFHASMIIELKARKEKKERGKGFPSHTVITATVAKNKLAAPYKEAEYILEFNGQINPISEIVNIVTNKEYMEILGVTLAGSWYTVPSEWFPDMEESKFQGATKFSEALEDLDAMERVRKFVLEKLKNSS
jgi:recombination protein RecA